jgi:hypothetical protein
LKQGYEIELARISDDEMEEEEEPAPAPPPVVKQPVEFDQAISYVNKIKVIGMTHGGLHLNITDLISLLLSCRTALPTTTGYIKLSLRSSTCIARARRTSNLFTMRCEHPNPA